MHRREFVLRIVQSTLLGSACGLSSGCGTLLHGERSGQPHSHQIDWKVAALDGLGLICFFVPGVVAFAVDFYTGAIYLPPGYAIDETRETLPDTTELVAIEVPRDELSLVRVEQEVSHKMGQPVKLDCSTTRVSEMPSIDTFATNFESHRKNRKFGFSLRRLIDRFRTA